MEHYPMIGTSKYEREQYDKGLKKKKDDMISDIAKLEAIITQGKEQTSIQLMDLLEKVIATCGGEHKIRFLDVSSNFIKVFTRVPMEANVFSFLPESDDNPRFHKVVTKILLLSPCVEGVRWLPGDVENRGSYLMISLKK